MGEAYCAGDPVNFIDPDGRLFGDFVDNKGYIIGNDGIDDGKVYVLKISKGEVFENSINGSEYSLDQLYEAKTFVEDYSGNADVFAMRPDIYDYFVEIVGNKDLRQEMVNIVGNDNGVRNYNEDNRREYGGYVVGDKVTMATPGKIDTGTINLYNTSTSFHSHPSGIDPNTNKVFQQYPSINDIKNNKGYTSYVFGRNCGVVYIYNNNGIISTIPHKYFVTFNNK